jgi:hypothetical protein
LSKPLTALSASRIKTLDKCSWSYWCNYVLKLPDSSNDGANRGDVVHLVLEMLSKPNRKKYVNKMIKLDDAFAIPSIKSLTLKRARQNKVSDPDNMKLIKEMILVGLKYDFFGDKEQKPVEDFNERSFDLVVDKNNKKYRIKGFIDRQFVYSDNSSTVRDYKTSKAVFAGKDAEDNLQHLMYTLASKQLNPDHKVNMEFLFLKFDVSRGGAGLLTMPALSDQELSDFEDHLCEVQKVIDGFSESDAHSNFAADKPIPSDGSFSGKLSCGFAKFKGQLKKDGNPMWHCPYKFAYNYYAVRDKDNIIVKTFSEEDKDEAFKVAKQTDKVTKEHYSGCPRHNKS